MPALGGSARFGVGTAERARAGRERDPTGRGAPGCAGGLYRFTGHSQPEVSYKANAIKTTAKGYRAIDFRDDGTRIEIVYPSYYMRGALLLLGLAVRARALCELMHDRALTQERNGKQCHVYARNGGPCSGGGCGR